MWPLSLSGGRCKKVGDRCDRRARVSLSAPEHGQDRNLTVNPDMYFSCSTH